MKQITDSATELALRDGSRVGTGYLLLAIAAGSGTASNLLRRRGLKQGAVKALLREMGNESPELLRIAFDKSRQIAGPLGAREPSALHMLAAIAGMSGSHASRLLDDIGVGSAEVKTQALRCLVGVTEERAAKDDSIRSGRSEMGAALPLPDQLRSLPQNREKRAAKQKTPFGENRAKEILRSIEVGRDLEMKQRMRQAARAEQKKGRIVFQNKEDQPKKRYQEKARSLSPVSFSGAGKSEVSFDLPPKEFPILSKLGRNLTLEAANGRLDEIIGRDREIGQMADVLSKRKANSPCLIGRPGVGKTAIVEGLSARVSRGELPGLEGRIVLEIRTSDLLSGTSLRGALAEHLSGIKGEVVRSGGRVVLFLDEIHALLASNDGHEAVQELKTALARGELPCIGATTHDAYAKYVESDPALARRFTPIEVEEPSQEEAVLVLEGVKPAYSAHHRVEFRREALEAAVRLSARYVAERALPDKAVALLDLAGARARRSGSSEVVARDVASILAEQLGVPVDRITAGDRERLLNIEGELAKRIVGHRRALTAIGETLRRNAAGFRSGRPIGSFLFLGSTGVGKTETAKALADILFPGCESMVHLDMSEFSEAHSTARLIGSPPGYVGHDEGGQLSEAVRRKPYCVVLLDEMEKAHREVLQILLQVLDSARLTDGRGRTVRFDNTLVIMTSNLGSDLRAHTRRVGFGASREAGGSSELSEAIISHARSALPPELWNRIDEPLVFEPLERDEVGQVATMLLNDVASQISKEHGVELKIGTGVVEALIEAGGYDPELGARPMRRTIHRMVEGPLAKLVLNDDATRGDEIEIVGDSADLEFEVRKAEKELIAADAPTLTRRLGKG